jgi:hypothetical protein
MDNASEIFSFGEGAFAQNPLNAGRPERGISGFDRRNAFSANFIYDLPFFRGQEGFFGKVAGGWQLNGTWIIASGRPFTVSQFSDFGFGIPSYEDNSFQSSFVGLDAVRPFIGNPHAPATSVAITELMPACTDSLLTSMGIPSRLYRVQLDSILSIH